MNKEQLNSQEQEVSPLEFTPSISNTLKPNMIETSIIDEDGKYRIVDKDFEDFSDVYEEYYRNFIATHKVENDINLSSDEKDKLYEEICIENEKFQKFLMDTEYKLHLTGDEVKILANILNHSVEYTIESIFIGIKLKNTIDTIVSMANKTDKFGIYTVNMSMFMLSLMIQLMKTHTWKGIGSKGITIYNILVKINNIDSVHNYFKAQYELNSNNMLKFVALISNDTNQ